MKQKQAKVSKFRQRRFGAIRIFNFSVTFVPKLKITRKQEKLLTITGTQIDGEDGFAEGDVKRATARRHDCMWNAQGGMASSLTQRRQKETNAFESYTTYVIA